MGKLLFFRFCFLSSFGGDNGLRESIVTDVLFVFEHFFYSVLKVSYYSRERAVNMFMVLKSVYNFI